MNILEFLINNWILILVAAFLSFVPGVRVMSQYYSTLVHEFGHGVLSGNPLGGLGGIKIRPDTSGENSVSYSGNIFTYGPVRIVSLMSGYAAPIYTGLIMLVLVGHGQIQILSWAIFIVTLLSFFAIRNLFGGLVILLHAIFWIIVFFVVPHIGNPASVIITVGLILLIKGFQDLIEVTKYVFVSKYKDMNTDFHILRTEFVLPRQVWYVMFLALHTCVLSLLVMFLLSI